MWSIVSSVSPRPSKPGRASRLDSFAARLLAWFERHGRHDLPWQVDVTPYRVWVSEIMLQQTQVRTVIPYFRRFVERFPDIRTLAEAPLDEVLALWSGLGYYARARNLHRAAGIVTDEHGGELPDSPESLMSLPGIGRSTAAAILALSAGRRHAILDGNVKRVLARYHGVEGWPGRTAVARELWAYAGQHTPETRVADYTQAIMDLGATVCTRGEPRCDRCPLASDCEGRRRGTASSLPAPRPKRDRPARRVTVLVVRNAAGETLLERRPPQGIWGGLLSFPELEPATSADEWCRQRLGAGPVRSERLPDVEHGFTHFDLTLAPLAVDVDARGGAVMDGPDWLWYKSPGPLPGGIAAPIERILRDVAERESEA